MKKNKNVKKNRLKERVSKVKTIKCNFKNVTESDKEKFKQSRCLFTISVGQQSHEGEHFNATIELLDSSFKSCIMLVDDSLQRYTMAMNTVQEPGFFYETSIKEGDLWLQRNKKYYGKLRNLEKIIRWDNWLQHEKFNEKKKAILELLETDNSYTEAFNSSSEEFISKFYKRSVAKADLNFKRLKKLSFDFILEECAALCLWPELNCAYEVYPNSHNAAINRTRQNFILDHRPNLLNLITLVFRNASQLAPQQFLCLDQKHNIPSSMRDYI